VDPFALGERELAAFRNQNVGFVFQDHCLLPQPSVLENVLAPSLVAEPKRDRTQRARELLSREFAAKTVLGIDFDETPRWGWWRRSARLLRSPGERRGS